MWKRLKNILYTIQTESGVYSINRVIPMWIIVIFTILMVGITIAAFVVGKSFLHYNDLCMVYLGVVVACGSWIQGNKITNSIWNTPSGAPGKPGVVADAVNKVAEAINKSADRTK